jgi:hypothetical protein
MEKKLKDWGLAGTLTHHQVICHKPCPKNGQSKRPLLLFPGYSWSSVSPFQHTAYFRLTLGMACHPDLHLTTLYLQQLWDCPTVHKTSYLIPSRDFSLLIVCVSRPAFWTIQPLEPFLCHSVTYISTICKVWCVIWELILVIKIRIKEPVLPVAHDYQVNSVVLDELKPMKLM